MILGFDKVLWHREALEKWYETGDCYPVHAEVGLTNACNHRCPWCSVAQMQRHATPTLMEPAILLPFLGQMRERGLKAVTLVGNGEPLSHPGAATIIRSIYDLGLEVGVFTNGSYLHGAVAATLLGCATFVRMTMNAASPETYAKTHGIRRDKADREFDRCVDNLREFRAYRAGRHTPTVGVQCATHQWNFRELPAQVRLVRDHIGADYFAVKPVINRSAFAGRVVTASRPRNEIPWEELESIMAECEALSTPEFAVYVKREQFTIALAQDYNEGAEYPSCVATPWECYIWEDGTFDICGPLRLGRPFNIQTHTFDQIWGSEERKRMIAAVDVRKCPAACRLHPLNKLLWGIRRTGLPPILMGPPPQHINFV